MPRIEEYTSPINTIRPDETGTLALARAGARIREDYREAGQQIDIGLERTGTGLKQLGQVVEQHETMQEIGQGSASLSDLQNKLTQQWNAMASAPGAENDPNLAAKFHQQVVQPALDQWQQQFHTPRGKEWGLGRSDALQSHLEEKSQADMSTLAGVAIHNNLQTTLDNSTQTILADPTSHDFVKSHIGQTVDALLANAPNLSAVDRARVKDDLVHTMNRKVDEAAFYTIVNKNSTLAGQMLAGGKFPDLDPAEAARYLGMAKRQDIAEARAARMEQRLAAQEASNTATRGYLGKLNGVESDQTLTPAEQMGQLRGLTKTIWQDPHLTPQAAMSLTSFMDGRLKEIETGDRVMTDPKVHEDLFSRALLSEDDPNHLQYADIATHYAKGDLSNADGAQLTKILNLQENNPDMRHDMSSLNKFFSGYKALITKSNVLQGTNDPQGDARFYQFTADKIQEALQARKAGVPMSQLLDPNSPQFIGRDLARYQVTNSQSLNAVQQGATGNVSPLPPVPHSPSGGASDQDLWRPGESMDDYVKRIGNGAR